MHKEKYDSNNKIVIKVEAESSRRGGGRDRE